jgi:hypothetical protein
MQQSDGLHEMGYPKWQLALCLLLVYCMLYLSLFKGVKSSGGSAPEGYEYFLITQTYSFKCTLNIRQNAAKNLYIVAGSQAAVCPTLRIHYYNVQRNCTPDTCQFIRFTRATLAILYQHALRFSRIADRNSHFLSPFGAHYRKTAQQCGQLLHLATRALMLDLSFSRQ